MVGATIGRCSRGTISTNGVTNNNKRLVRGCGGDNGGLLNSFLSLIVRCTIGATRDGTYVGQVITTPATNDYNVVPTIFVTCRRCCGMGRSSVVGTLFATSNVNRVITRGTSVDNTRNNYRTRVNATTTVTTNNITCLRNKGNRYVTGTTTLTLGGVLNLIYSPITKLIRIPYVGQGTVNTMGTVATTRVTLTKVGDIVPTSRIVSTVFRVNYSLPTYLERASRTKLTTAPATLGVRGGLHSGKALY